jgi:hypothetical protein
MMNSRYSVGEAAGLRSRGRVSSARTFQGALTGLEIVDVDGTCQVALVGADGPRATEGPEQPVQKLIHGSLLFDDGGACGRGL